MRQDFASPVDDKPEAVHGHFAAIMDLLKMISELKQERDHLDDVITQIERLAARRNGKSRSRPPKWLKEERSIKRPEKTREEPEEKWA